LLQNPQGGHISQILNLDTGTGESKREDRGKGRGEEGKCREVRDRRRGKMKESWERQEWRGTKGGNQKIEEGRK